MFTCAFAMIRMVDRVKAFFEIYSTCRRISRGQYFKIYIKAIRGVLSSEFHDVLYYCKK